MTGQVAFEALTAAVDDTLGSSDLAAPMTRLFNGLIAAGWPTEQAAIAASVAVVTASVTAHLVEPLPSQRVAPTPVALVAQEGASDG